MIPAQRSCVWRDHVAPTNVRSVALLEHELAHRSEKGDKQENKFFLMRATVYRDRTVNKLVIGQKIFSCRHF